MKIRRSERLIDMTQFLLSHPRKLVPLTMFAERYGSAKSSISEDLVIIKKTFEDRGIGTLETVPGAAGGVQYISIAGNDDVLDFVHTLCNRIAEPNRLLPGGYLYLSDLLGEPVTLKAIGKILATKFNDKKIDAIMTVATKGIPIAQAVAEHLSVPFVIVRRDSKVTEGSTVSINYVSGSSKRIEKMELSKRSLAEGSNVVIVDDFMKAGGTINGMKNLLEEFNAHLVGIGVLVESEYAEERLVDDYVSLVKIKNVNMKEKQIEVVDGNYFNS
ncbi:pur operon repressor [Listeria sp. FSL L7-1485]|uniref:Pur operon repressor n=1 Tax=Listeria immobilis TaxID=2713502 RepID=A0A7X0X561_9LIST|nr:pur operon repressor [Listeria immobilis]MBC1484186.1 pur operon repressor [Listeria immobilis]MBC1487705.1 pur operon repressor [Listeria immobilis]MBC1508009.1 pur operon repressor [Listeria immobilis]MBC1511090.1 pur operon repressor [Listeria immobilis]MBC1516211.1 pur operon repressor [Listeria immobilis]